MKKSFTLIEVMLSVMIIFMVVSIIINISSNIKHLFLQTKTSLDFSLEASVGAIENPNVSNLYEKLKDFNISNDKIIKTLKNKKQLIEQKTEFVNSVVIKNKNIDIIMNKIKIYNKTNSNIVYEIKIK